MQDKHSAKRRASTVLVARICATAIAIFRQYFIAVVGQFFILGAAFGQTVYKCDAGGRIVYQAVPCPGNGREVYVAPAGSARAPSPPVDSGQRYRDYLKREHKRITEQERLDDLAHGGQVAVGMTPEQVIKAWGSPTAVNTGIYATAGSATTVSEQWVYRKGRGSKADYIYLRDGKVTSIQLER